MEKKYIFVDKNHDYVYVKREENDNTIHELFYSESDPWDESVKGNLILGVTDDGNGYKFHSKNKKYLQYDEGFELSILMRIITKDEADIKLTSSIEEL